MTWPRGGGCSYLTIALCVYVFVYVSGVMGEVDVRMKPSLPADSFVSSPLSPISPSAPWRGGRVICSVLWCRHGALVASAEALAPIQPSPHFLHNPPPSPCCLMTPTQPTSPCCLCLLLPSSLSGQCREEELLTQASRGNKLTWG